MSEVERWLAPEPGLRTGLSRSGSDASIAARLGRSFRVPVARSYRRGRSDILRMFRVAWIG